jgi:hypothetical protein
MFKVTCGRGDFLRVVGTYDDLDTAMREARWHSRTLATWTTRAGCVVDVRDVKDVVICTVNFWDGLS